MTVAAIVQWRHDLHCHGYDCGIVARFRTMVIVRATVPEFRSQPRIWRSVDAWSAVTATLITISILV